MKLKIAIKSVKIIKWIALVIATPVVLFLLLAVCVYIPPIQRYLVNKTTAYLSESTGFNISAKEIRLVFPLDMAVRKVCAVNKGDTLASMDILRLNIPIKPIIFNQIIDISGFEMYRATLNTQDCLNDIYINGKVGMLGLETVSAVNLRKKLIDINSLKIKNTNVDIILSDTARQDTSENSEPVSWKIKLGKANLANTIFQLQLPDDSMKIAAEVTQLAVADIDVNLQESCYKARKSAIVAPYIKYDVTQTDTLNGGFDVNHIALYDVHLQMNELNYCGNKLSAKLPLLAFKEKSGIELQRLSCDIYLDSTQIGLSTFIMKTPNSQMKAKILADWSSLKADGKGNLMAKMNGFIGKSDLLLYIGENASTLDPLIPSSNIELDLEASGNIDKLTINKATLNIPTYVLFKVEGQASNLMNDKLRKADIDYKLNTVNMKPYNQYLSKTVGSGFKIPSNLTMTGKMNCLGDEYSISSTVKALGGDLKLMGKYGLSSEEYHISVAANHFPLSDFIVSDTISPLTASITAEGRGMDFLKKSAKMKIDAKIHELYYNGHPLDSISIIGNLLEGHGDLEFKIHNAMADANASIKAQIEQNKIQMKVNGNVPELDLRYLGERADTFKLHTDFVLNGSYQIGDESFGISGLFSRIFYTSPSEKIPSQNFSFQINNRVDSTYATIESGDLKLILQSDSTFSAIINSCSNFTDILVSQIKNAHISHDSLITVLPEMKLDLQLGQDNPLYSILKALGYDYKGLTADLSTGRTNGIAGNMFLEDFRNNNLLLEKTSLNVSQDSKGLHIKGCVENKRKRNPYRFKADVKGDVLMDEISASVTYLDEKNVKGLDFGARASFNPSGDITLNIFPYESVIAYRTFKVNANNFITLRKNGGFSADIDLLADDQTGLKVITPEGDSVRDISASINNLNLNELTEVLPYLPRLGGMFTGDVHVMWQDSTLSAVGQIDLKDFMYEQCQLGNIEADLSYVPENSEKQFISANISSEHQEVFSVFGNYIMKGDGSLDMTASLMHLPASMVNGFMSTDGTIGLNGFIDGDVNIHGPISSFLVDGEIKPDSLHILSSLYGVNLSVENKPIRVAESKLKLDNLSMYSINETPLITQGVIDFSNLSKVKIDLDCNAHNFLVVNSEQTKQSVVFGKVFADIAATVKGTSGFMAIKGDLGILSNTDMTYVMKDSPLTAEDQLEGLVEFKDFSDSVEVVKSEPASQSSIYMLMNIHMNEAAKLHVNLSEDGNSYFDCRGGGNLVMKYLPSGDITLTGRFNMSQGEMKYTLPFIPLKTFTLQGNNNYVAFTGNPMNPSINITAMEQTRASVCDDESSTRMVKFNVGVAITQTLQNMGLQFLIEAPSDIKIQNELASMSKEDQGRMAVSLLVTGMYLSSTNKSSYKANNALNSFLQSQIQNIAGDALKTVDLTIGVEGSTTAAGQAQTDYSFQFAKHLWNDRVTFCIGGKVSTGSSTSENQSFIDNISLEYRLGEGNSRYMRLFYDHDKTDPLEGNYSIAGAGFVLRKKTNTFGELFIFRHRKKKEQE